VPSTSLWALALTILVRVSVWSLFLPCSWSLFGTTVRMWLKPYFQFCTAVAICRNSAEPDRPRSFSLLSTHRQFMNHRPSHSTYNASTFVPTGSFIKNSSHRCQPSRRARYIFLRFPIAQVHRSFARASGPLPPPFSSTEFFKTKKKSYES